MNGWQNVIQHLFLPLIIVKNLHTYQEKTVHESFLYFISDPFNFQEYNQTQPQQSQPHSVSNSSGLIILATLSILLNIYFLVRLYLKNRTKNKRISRSESTVDAPNKNQEESTGNAPNKNHDLNHIVVESNSTVAVSSEEKT